MGRKGKPARSVRWFHGGVPGLEPGALLLPPSETGNATLGQYGDRVAAETGTANPHRSDRVYLTSDVRMAVPYAGVVPDGDVYEAVPLGRIEPDPDCRQPGLSVQCARARIVRVIRRGVTAREAARRVGAA